MAKSIPETLSRLKTSKFRSSFHLTEKDKEYIQNKGPAVIESHARDFVRKRLSPAYPVNDGKQTPMSSHPVFKAMHATATCCRGCPNKWYRVEKGVPLTSEQQEKIVHLIMAWINEQLS